NGPVVGIALVAPKEEVLLMTDRGQTIRTRCEEIRETGRNAQGVRVMNVGEEERVVALEVVAESDDDDDDFGEGEGGEGVGEGGARLEGDASAEGDAGEGDTGAEGGEGEGVGEAAESSDTDTDDPASE